MVFTGKRKNGEMGFGRKKSVVTGERVRVGKWGRVRVQSNRVLGEVGSGAVTATIIQ